MTLGENAAANPYNFTVMIRARLVHRVAPLLLGAFIVAYATVSLRAWAAAPAVPAAAEKTSAAHSLHGAAHNAVDAAGLDDGFAAADEHCDSRNSDVTALMCKYHCQSAVQTLDHPDAGIPVAAAIYLLLPASPLRTDHAAVLAARRPDAAHHGGAPPPFRSTARLRI
jgi:hypothetical protein